MYRSHQFLTCLRIVFKLYFMKNNLFNIPAGKAVVDVLAEKFLAEYAENPLDLADVVFLLPNRRAVKALADAFVRRQALKPTLLPKMVPIGDVEEDELFLTGFDFAEGLVGLAPAIERNERLLLFTKIILRKPTEFGIEKLSANQACYLAQELANLVDTVQNENLSFDKLTHLVPAEYAAHWQETLKFLEIITAYWPDILKERGLIDPSERRNRLLLTQARMWQDYPPRKRIVAVGTTATFPAMKKVVKTILNLPRGEVYLAGLERYLDEDDWEVVDETHPQYELKQLLQFLNLPREAVQDLVPTENSGREVFISEIMRPAKTTDRWRDITAKKIYHEAYDGIRLINCADVRKEALAIALIMRETLETPEKTAALVTTDRNLARRVAAELQRWEIKVDDSAGLPLALTPVGIFLRQIIKTVQSDFAPVEFLSLLKLPLMTCGEEYAAIRRQVRDYEKKVLRGGREDENLEKALAKIREKFRDLQNMLSNVKADFKNLLRVHIQTAEMLAALPETDGSQLLWKGDAGEAAAGFIGDLYQTAEVLENIDTAEYLGLLEAMMSSVTVRPKYGTHPRLKILGPIEARLTQFDTVIIGEVNEGAFPKLSSADPWMSRPMKKEFGFPLPEKAIGVLAHDFCQLLASKRVYLTRAERVQGTPMVKSRWWMRLETVLKALQVDISDLEDEAYNAWAEFLDRVEVFKRLLPPEPRPPVEARPRVLSASAVENWMRDPYIIFAKYILKLKPLEELEPDLSLKDYGTIIHAVLEKFNNLHSAEFPVNAKEELLALGQEYFKENKIAMETRAFWWPAFEKTVDWLVGAESAYRSDIKKIHSEVEGRFSFEAPAGTFTITAKADRVDETSDGKINIIDYKTGYARSVKEIEEGYAPQLPIEGLIAKFGGFEDIPAAEINKLIYWQLGRTEIAAENNMDELLDKSYERIVTLASVFDFEKTAYISRPNPKHAPKYSDYEHLSRLREWSVAEDADE